MAYERIILEVDEAIARKWNALSGERKAELIRYMEELVLQLLSDNDDFVRKTVSEPSPTYRSTAKKTEEEQDERQIRLQKVRDAFCRFDTDLSDFTFNREEANERKPNAEDIKSFYAAFRVDMDGYTFNREEANER